MPPLNAFSGSIIGAARGVNAMLQSQIKALELQRQREREKAEDEMAREDQRLRRLDVESAARLRTAQAEASNATSGAVTAEAEARELAFQRYVNGIATTDDLTLIGLRQPAKPSDTPSNMVEAAWMYAQGLMPAENFVKFADAIKNAELLTPADRLLMQVFERLPDSLPTQVVKTNVGGAMEFEMVDLPIDPVVRTGMALETMGTLMPLMGQLNSLKLTDDDLALKIDDIIGATVRSARMRNPTLYTPPGSGMSAPGTVGITGTNSDMVQVPSRLTSEQVAALVARQDSLRLMQQQIQQAWSTPGGMTPTDTSKTNKPAAGKEPSGGR